MTTQVRHWSFTWYEVDKVPFWNPDKMVYMIFQPEMCPTTNRLHFQGYVAFKRSMKIGMVKKALMSKTVHVEPIHGTPDQARHYCMKPVEGCVCKHCVGEGVRIEGGEISEFGDFAILGQGKRSDLENVVKDIKEGKGLKEIVNNHTSAAIRYYKGINFVRKLINVKERPKTITNIILWGDTGCFKSTFAWSKYGNIWNGYLPPGWWEGYDHQEAALYDEFDGKEHMDVSLFKKITDRFPVTVPCKGDSHEYTTGINIFNSNINPRDWYPRYHWEAIKRRMNHIVHCQKFNDELIYNCEVCIDNCDIVNEIKEISASHCLRLSTATERHSSGGPQSPLAASLPQYLLDLFL